MQHDKKCRPILPPMYCSLTHDTHESLRSVLQAPVETGQVRVDEVPDSDDEAAEGQLSRCKRAASLGSRCSLEGLSKVSRDTTGTIYELCLGC